MSPPKFIVLQHLPSTTQEFQGLGELGWVLLGGWEAKAKDVIYKPNKNAFFVQKVPGFRHWGKICLNLKFESKLQKKTNFYNSFFLVIKWIYFHSTLCCHLPGNVSRGWVGLGAACSNAPGVQEVKSKGTGFRYVIATVILYDSMIIRSGSGSLRYYHPMGCMLPTTIRFLKVTMKHRKAFR